MLLYDRVVSVTAGPPEGGQGISVNGLRVRFAIDRTEDSKENTVQLVIYNLGESSRASFEKIGNRISISAGYAATGPQLLAIGDIVSAKVDYDHPEIVLQIEAADGGKALRTARANVSYSAGTPAKKMIEDLVGRLGVDLPDIPFDLSESFASGWAFSGRASAALDQLSRRFGFSWSIQNNALQITETRKPSKRQAVLLSASSGMIGSPSPLDDVRGEAEDAKDKEQPGVLVKALLNPALIPGDPVVINSNYRGSQTYRVRRVRHRGDTHGNDWISEVECIEVK